MLKHMTQAVGPLACNCTVLFDESTREAMVVDPGGDADKIIAILEQHRLQATALVHTHAHIDHVGATAELLRVTGATAYLHPDDFELYSMLGLQAQFLGIAPVATVQMRPIHDGDILMCGRSEVAMMHTPGHSPGSISLDLGASKGMCLSGDTLFANGVGRTDLWGGDLGALKKSIVERLLVLPCHTVIVPGHGALTTVDQERHNLMRRFGRSF